MRKVVLITGGSRGIGKYLVDELRHEYDISTCSRTIQEVDTGGFLSMKCDLGNKREVDGFVNSTMDKFGHIDIMIYNAGSILYDEMLSVKEDTINALYEVTVKGYLFVCQAVIPVMREQGCGCIINIGSIRGLSAA